MALEVGSLPLSVLMVCGGPRCKTIPLTEPGHDVLALQALPRVNRQALARAQVRNDLPELAVLLLKLTHMPQLRWPTPAYF